jgi:hypothetical protein
MKEAANHNQSKTTPNKISENNDLITDPKEIAKMLNLHFSQIANTVVPDAAVQQPNFDALRHFVDNRLPKKHQFTIPLMPADYLLNEINNLSCHKAKGIDVQLLKIGCNEILPSLLHIYNSSITSGIFPDQWKIGKITPVFKKAPDKIKIIIDQSL